jgi:tetratricopeptide (TPR) repeat protein
MAEKKEETLVDVVEAYSKTEKYIDENQKSLTVIIGAIVLIVGGFFAYKKMYVEPLEIEAQSQMFMAEKYFAADSVRLAINGDGNYLGFLDIIDEYSITPSGNLALYYAGICYYKQGQYQEAIEMLSSFDGDDQMVGAVANGAIGDAYMELGEVKHAISYYMDAANHSRNDFTCPVYLMKAAGSYEDQGNYNKAVDIYNDIKENFADTKEGLEVDKYLARAKALASN